MHTHAFVVGLLASLPMSLASNHTNGTSTDSGLEEGALVAIVIGIVVVVAAVAAMVYYRKPITKAIMVTFGGRQQKEVTSKVAGDLPALAFSAAATDDEL